MRSGLTGWLVAVVAAITAGSLLVWGWRQHQEAAGLRDHIEALGQQIEKLNVALVEKDATLRHIEAKVAEKPAPSPGQGEKPSQDAGSFLGRMVAAVAGAPKDDTAGQGESEGTQDSPLSGIAQMYAGEQGKELARQSAGVAVTMQYGQLLLDLHLPPDVEERVRKALTENVAEQITAGIEAMQDNAAPEAHKRMRDDGDAKLRAELGALLSPDEMAVYDEYEDTMPKRMLAQSIDMQLNMFAPGMTPENRTRARDVMVEEMVPTMDGQRGTGFPPDGDFQSQITAQQEAYGRARDRLAQEFDGQQVAQVDRFITQLQQMTESSMRMMGNMRPRDDQPK